MWARRPTAYSSTNETMGWHCRGSQGARVDLHSTPIRTAHSLRWEGCPMPGDFLRPILWLSVGTAPTVLASETSYRRCDCPSDCCESAVAGRRRQRRGADAPPGFTWEIVSPPLRTDVAGKDRARSACGLGFALRFQQSDNNEKKT